MTQAALLPSASPLAPWFYGAMGLCLGSFLNVVIHRLPLGRSVVRGRSRCPHCDARVRARDNLPVVGWLLLRGRCRDCGAGISPRYPLVELAGGLLLLLALRLGEGPAGIAAAGTLALALLAIAVIDLDHRLIPDAITLPGALIGLLAAPWLGVGRLDALAGAVVGGGFFLAAQILYRRWRGRSGLGGGDVKLGLMIGAWLGWQGVLLTILFGSFLGSVLGLALLATGRTGRETRLPYGAFLAPAGILVLFWGRPIWDWYLALAV